MKKIILPDGVLLGEVERMIGEGHEVVIVPKGRSMLPFIHDEIDKVVLTKPSGLRVGDIVLACFDGRYVLHRIIAIDGELVTLMGDGNLQGKERGPANKVIGVVTEIITPKGRHKKPTKGWLWRKLLPVRKYLLKIYRKWYKMIGKHF